MPPSFTGIDIVPAARVFHIDGGDGVMRVMEGGARDGDGRYFRHGSDCGRDYRVRGLWHYASRRALCPVDGSKRSIRVLMLSPNHWQQAPGATASTCDNRYFTWGGAEGGVGAAGAEEASAGRPGSGAGGGFEPGAGGVGAASD